MSVLPEDPKKPSRIELNSSLVGWLAGWLACSTSFNFHSEKLQTVWPELEPLCRLPRVNLNQIDILRSLGATLHFFFFLSLLASYPPQPPIFLLSYLFASPADRKCSK